MKYFYQFSMIAVLMFTGITLSNAQTNVYDDVIATSPNHTSLDAAIQAAGLENALRDANASYTVFAPDNAAFTNLANELGITVPNLLTLPNLSDILLYHVFNQAAVSSSQVNNGDIITPMNAANTLKLTVTSTSDVFVNQAQVNAADLTADNGIVHSLDAVVLSSETVADVAIDNGFSILVDAVVTAELLPALTDPFAELTVFAPNNTAFNGLLTELGISGQDLLNDPELADILLYHVLGAEVASSAVTTDTVRALNDEVLLKLTKSSTGNVVFINQAEVITPDVIADNGVVHVIDEVLLPNETVIDIALETSDYSSLATAVMTAELMPALSDPFAEFTVFAPNNAAFNDAVSELGITINDLLASQDLADILLYHVLDAEVDAASVSNGDVVDPLNTANSLKFTKTGSGDVFVNQAQVNLPDVFADNGVVHGIDEVVLANETVVDVALDNGFSTLATAVITAELLPALTDPFEEYTVFAPTNEDFDTLAAELNTDIPGILALPNLDDILLYHVVDGTVLSGQLSNGPVTTLSGSDVTVNVDNGVMINTAMVTLADLTTDNGVVHVINEVLQETPASVEEVSIERLSFFPNPIVDQIRIENVNTNAVYNIFSVDGRLVETGYVNGGLINVSDLESGSYIINVEDSEALLQGTMIKL